MGELVGAIPGPRSDSAGTAPGRYVRAEEQEDDGELFDQKIARRAAQPSEQQAEARRSGDGEEPKGAWV